MKKRKMKKAMTKSGGNERGKDKVKEGRRKKEGGRGKKDDSGKRYTFHHFSV